jgi:hypothetical protein
MKIRKGFVSNSSTTSFTCEACGEIVSYHDSCSDEDIGRTRFSCGHTTCSCTEVDLSKKSVQNLWRKDAEKQLREPDCGPEDEALDEILKIKDFWKFVDACRDYEVYNPSALCPVCSFKAFNDDFVYRYILLKHKLKLDDVRKEMKKRFKSFDEFEAWMKENKEE